MKPSGSSLTTRWTDVIQIIQSGDPTAGRLDRALADFYEQYRSVCLDFFRKHGCSPEKAEDYYHDFLVARVFSRLDERNSFIHRAERTPAKAVAQETIASPSEPRIKLFRSLLFTVLWRFYCDKRREEISIRAGGGVEHVSTEEVGDRLPDEPERKQRERQFDRTFAREVFARAADRSGRSPVLQDHFLGLISQKEGADALDISEGAFRVAYMRFREHLRQNLRQEVSQLAVLTEGEIDDEIRYLLTLLTEPEM